MVLENNSKILLIITAVSEGLTGLALIVVPERVTSLLLDVTLAEPAGIIVAKLAGATLLSLAFVCWLYRNDRSGAVGIITGMLFYNSAAIVLLIYAWSDGFAGLALWSVVLLHIGLGLWCFRQVFFSTISK